MYHSCKLLRFLFLLLFSHFLFFYYVCSGSFFKTGTRIHSQLVSAYSSGVALMLVLQQAHTNNGICIYAPFLLHPLVLYFEVYNKIASIPKAFIVSIVDTLENV